MQKIGGLEKSEVWNVRSLMIVPLIHLSSKQKCSIYKQVLCLHPGLEFWQQSILAKILTTRVDDSYKENGKHTNGMGANPQILTEICARI